MKSSKEWFKAVSLLCGEVCPGDGVNPRYDSTRSGRKTSRHKMSQVCKKASKVLVSIFQGETIEPILSSLQIVSVELDGEGQYLSVTIGHTNKDIEYDEFDIQLALSRAKGYLRTELAQSINRKRVPMLKFKYIGLID